MWVILYFYFLLAFLVTKSSFLSAVKKNVAVVLVYMVVLIWRRIWVVIVHQTNVASPSRNKFLQNLAKQKSLLRLLLLKCCNCSYSCEGETGNTQQRVVQAGSQTCDRCMRTRASVSGSPALTTLLSGHNCSFDGVAFTNWHNYLITLRKVCFLASRVHFRGRWRIVFRAVWASEQNILQFNNWLLFQQYNNWLS